ncbi:major type 1 subunit fimbrin (pilin) [Atlantibacter sp. RC6]|nr:fimbrial protein [Atlantibacter sp. RC6]MBB3324713.1 major type 1 subunit fimbrin (pilin) [Atlantibacter sp. RC6]
MTNSIKEYKMFKSKISACLLAMGFIAFGANAVDPVTQGTVTFNGKLIVETCSIVSGDENLTVTLPTLSTASLKTPGDEAGSTSFDIHAENCDPSLTKVGAHFEAIGSTGADMATGNLINAAPAANKAAEVEVRLYDADGTPMTIGTTGQMFDIDSTTHKATMRYIGGYYATGVTTAGDVTAKVNYTLAYP